MKKLSDEQNLAFMNDPRRHEAEKELHDIVRHIRTDIKADGNAMYYLTVLPPLIKKLEIANGNLNVVEAQILCEMEEKAK